MKNIAVILSGGKGIRFGGLVPKQYYRLAGKKIYEYSIDVFQACDLIDEIIVVAGDEYALHILSSDISGVIVEVNK